MSKRELYFKWKGKFPETPQEKKVFSKLTTNMILSYMAREGKNV